MEQSGFQFGRRVEDQLDLLRALVAQGRVEAETARVCYEELVGRAQAARQAGRPRRRWTDHAGRGVGPVGLVAASEGVASLETPPPSARRAGVGRRLDPERRRRLIQRVSTTSLPVRLAGVLSSRPALSEVPMVLVDGALRPDVADLPRVFRTEAIPAEARSRWLFVMDDRGRGCALLFVGVSRPVRCRFRLMFSMLHDRALLGMIGRAGGFVMTCADPNLDRDRALFEAMYVAVPSEVLALLGDDRSGTA